MNLNIFKGCAVLVEPDMMNVESKIESTQEFLFPSFSVMRKSKSSTENGINPH